VSHAQDLSLREQAAAVRAGDLDPSELLSATFERIEERDGELNSVVDRFPEEAERMLAEARDGPAAEGPLYGVPVAVKDIFALPLRGQLD
jgi:amidase